MTLVNLTNQSYFINLKQAYNGSRTLIIMPFATIVLPDTIASEKEVRAKALKRLIRVTEGQAPPSEPPAPPAAPPESKG